MINHKDNTIIQGDKVEGILEFDVYFNVPFKGICVSYEDAEAAVKGLGLEEPLELSIRPIPVALSETMWEPILM